MAKTQVGVDVKVGRYGKDAAGSHNLVAFDENGSVMKRGVLEKERLQQGGGDNGVDTLAGVDNLVDFVLADKDNQGSRLALRHVHASLNIGFEVEA